MIHHSPFTIHKYSKHITMNRREALSSVALLLGGTLIGSTAFLTGCKTSGTDSGISFSPEEISFLNEVGETILPATSSPGAKEANVGEFMARYVADCYEAKDQVIFKEGFKKLDEASKKKNNETFLKSTPEQRTALLTEIDKEAKEYQKTKKEEDPNHYFRMFKELTLFGFFTSEVGATKALRHVAIPGKYEGCIPYKPGDKAWA